MSKIILKIVSFAGLGLTLIPALIVFSNGLDLDSSKNLMLLGTILWFGTSPFWMNKSKQAN